jgi:DNA-binding NarL/FixJ family response regulator
VRLLSSVFSEGETYLDPSILASLRISKNFKGLTSLTSREFEIFIQSYSGKSDEKIAEDLCIELSHVKNLKSKITKKIKNDNIGNFVIELVKNSQPDCIRSS